MIRNRPDIAVVGAGVVGLACAAELARRGRTIVVLERHDRPGTEISSRNSQVIHAGIYYPPESLKARCCVEGRELLYERCRRYSIPHRQVGKLVIATEEHELSSLEAIRVQAHASGAAEVAWRDRRAALGLEPRVRALSALWSPRTGIVDAVALVASYLAELEASSGAVALETRVVGLEPRAEGWRVETVGGDGRPFTLEVPWVVNAAGLESDRVAEMAGIDVDRQGWRLRLCKGDYFSADPGLGALTRHLVYPLPQEGGLGIHVTMDLGGRYRFGPDAEYVAAIDYRVDPAKRTRFAAAVRRYLPEVSERHLEPDGAGIRPKLAGPGDRFADFVIEESSALGAPQMVQLVGIESPGLTAAGAIARRVAALIGCVGS